MNTIYFDDINSYYDLNLILNPFEIPPAEPKTNYLDVPGADGELDLTEAHGAVKYKSRSASAVFSVWRCDDWEQKKTEISNLLNGRKCKIRKSSDPDWYFEGRCTVKSYKCDKFNRTITVDMRLQPWKLKVNETVIKISGERLQEYEFNLKNSRMPVCPVFTTKFGFDMVVKDASANDVWYHASDNSTIKWLDVQLTEGDNFIEIYPNDSAEDEITITYQEGAL